MQKKKGSIHSVDRYAGERLRYARCRRRMSQDCLAKGLPEPITFQQIQKYERGSNRMSASRLYDLAKFLEVPPAFFFPEEEYRYLILSQRKIKVVQCFDRLSEYQQNALLTLLAEGER